MLVGTVGYLMASGIKRPGAYYLTPTELVDADPADRSFYNVGVKMGARVVKGSITRDVATQTHRRSAPPTARTSYPVEYRGLAPDTFTDDVDVVVEGRLQPDGTFRATTLLAKCGVALRGGAVADRRHGAGHRARGGASPLTDLGNIALWIALLIGLWGERRGVRGRADEASGPGRRSPERAIFALWGPDGARGGGADARPADARLQRRVRGGVHQPQPADLLHVVGVLRRAEGLAAASGRW